MWNVKLMLNIRLTMCVMLQQLQRQRGATLRCLWRQKRFCKGS